MSKTNELDVQACGCGIVLIMLFGTFVLALGIGCIAFLRWVWGMAFA